MTGLSVGMKHLCMVALFCFAFCGSAMPQDELAAEWEKARVTYREWSQKLEQHRNEAKKECGDTYLASLNRLRAHLADQEDLDGLVAVKDAFTRFEGARVLKEHMVVHAPVALHKLQTDYLEAMKEVRLKHAREHILLADRYDRRLKQIQDAFTRKEQVTQALKIRAERGKLDRDEELQAARALVKAEEEKEAAVAARPDPPPDPPPVAVVEPADPSEGGVYAPNQAPRVSGRRMNLDFTSQASRALAARMTVTLIAVEDTSKTKDPDASGSTYNMYHHKVIRPRMTLRNGNAPLSACRVYVQSYARAQGGDRTLIQETCTEIPAMQPGESLVVDAPEHRIETETVHVHSHDNYSHVTSSRYKDAFGGFVISIFDAQDDMVFQKCSQPSLKDYAPQSPPRKREETAVARPPVSVHSPTPREPAEDDGPKATVYTENTPPPFRGEILNLDFTGRKSRAVSSVLSVQPLLKEEDTVTRKKSYPGASYYYRCKVNRIQLRLNLRGGLKDVPPATLVIQYFNMPHNRRSNVVLAKTERIDLPEIKARQPLVVDAAGHDYVQSRQYVSTEGGHTGSATSVRDTYGGVLISVFARDDGRMLYQRRSDISLDKFAVDTLGRIAGPRD